MAKMNVEDLSPELRKQLGIRSERKPQRLNKDDIRSYGIAAMNQLRDLTKPERDRVIRYMTRLNEV